MPKHWRKFATNTQPYESNQPFLESQRITVVPSPRLQPVLKDPGGLGDGLNMGHLFEPDPSDFKDLNRALGWFKFSESQTKALYDLIGSGIKLASVVGSVVGAYETVKKLGEIAGIFSKAEDEIQAQLAALQEKVDTIYEYLGNADKRGLHNQEVAWRAAMTVAEFGRASVLASRSQLGLESLDDRLLLLEFALNEMLNVKRGSITFQRSTYGYFQPSSYELKERHWIDYATAPFLMLADGSPIAHYAHPIHNLRAEIWDAGYYVEVLLSSLRELIVVYNTLEPGFRSTGYFRSRVSHIAGSIATFVDRWRKSIFVADPSACLAADGRMVNGYNPAPDGLLVGAVDPVTGISNLAVWGNFPIKKVMDWQIQAEAFTPDRTYAIDPTAALALAYTEHNLRVDSVVKASGILKLTMLQKEFEELARPAADSQFVVMPVAKFSSGLWGISGNSAIDASIPIVQFIGEEVSIDLGKLDKFAPQPGRKFVAKRFRRQMQKSFVFKMLRRSTWSGIQLGYKLVVGGKVIELCPFSTAPQQGISALHFPQDALHTPLSLQLPVANCCQTRHYSQDKENRFERDGGAEDRVFVHIGDGQAQVEVSVKFNPLAGGQNEAFVGEAEVTISTVPSEQHSDAYELPVSVLEVVAGLSGPSEIVADGANLFMTPSYLLVEQSYIDAYRQAFQNMLESVKKINYKFKLELSQLGPPNPLEDPDWTSTKMFAVERGMTFLERSAEIEPRMVAAELAYFQAPIIVGR